MALENGIERKIELTKDAPSDHISGSQPEVGLHGASPSATPRSTPGRITHAPVHRGAKTHTASRPGGNPNTRVPIATSTRGMTMRPAAPRGDVAHAARRYIDSANRQMDKGNYTAAIANYKRALQVDENSSAAKGCLERARRAMQAENKIIASRR